MKYFEFSKDARGWNEDASFANEKYAFVLDGASGISGQKFSKMETDAKWYSNKWKDYLIKNLSKKRSIFDILTAGVKKISNEYRKYASDKKIEDFPSCTIALVRELGQELEFYVLGDSPIFVRTIHNRIISIEDLRSVINEDITKIYAEEVAKKENISIVEARKKYPEIVKNGRIKRNSNGHFYVLADSVEAVNHGFRFQIEKKLVDKVVLMSDGYADILDFNILTKESIFNKINNNNDAQKYYKKLVKVQNKDIYCQKYPRFKITDDSTIVVVKY